MSENLSDTITVIEAAKRMKVTPGRIRQMISRGQLQSLKIGTMNFISNADLKKIIRARKLSADRS